MLANDTIGTGPRLQFLTEDDSLNDRIEHDFLRWSAAVSLPEKLRLMRIARCQDGESFAMFQTNPKKLKELCQSGFQQHPYKFDLQLLHCLL